MQQFTIFAVISSFTFILSYCLKSLKFNPPKRRHHHHTTEKALLKFWELIYLNSLFTASVLYMPWNDNEEMLRIFDKTEFIRWTYLEFPRYGVGVTTRPHVFDELCIAGGYLSFHAQGVVKVQLHFPLVSYEISGKRGNVAHTLQEIKETWHWKAPFSPVTYSSNQLCKLKLSNCSIYRWWQNLATMQFLLHTYIFNSIERIKSSTCDVKFHQSLYFIV